MHKERILSGNRPTGTLHLGHLVGILENWASLQDAYLCFFEVADWHVLTTAYQNPGGMEENIKEMVAGWLSTGIDPERSVIFLQSHVKEHAELHLLFSMITTISRLERNPTYKEQIQNLGLEGNVSYGLLGYPVLQAADILIYRAHAVPIGQDQLPHLELSREMARRFNYLYGDIFPVPEPILTNIPRLAGTDGRKMSNSLNNAIFLSDDAAVLWEKVQRMVTDPGRVRLKDPGSPEVCSIYQYHRIFSNPGFFQEVGPACREAQVGCHDCKKKLTAILNLRLTPIREKRKEVLSHTGRIEEILSAGSTRARAFAQQTLEQVRESMHLFTLEG